jgi:hypothetical protein
VAGPSALIGASNFFEVAVATAIALFGFQSGAALATVVGVPAVSRKQISAAFDGGCGNPRCSMSLVNLTRPGPSCGSMILDLTRSPILMSAIFDGMPVEDAYREAIKLARRCDVRFVWVNDQLKLFHAYV